jgi:hypothetical protein
MFLVVTLYFNSKQLEKFFKTRQHSEFLLLCIQVNQEEIKIAYAARELWKIVL